MFKIKLFMWVYKHLQYFQRFQSLVSMIVLYDSKQNIIKLLKVYLHTRKS